MAQDTDLRAAAKAISASVQIGKNGVTDGMISQITDQLDAKGIVKIK